MSKKIKKYRVSPDESLCLAVSVVDKPAVQSEFVYMSEQTKENFVAVEKKEKRMIYGCALRADFPIYRNSPEKGEYYLEFDAEAIDKISKNFMKNGFQSNWTVGHEAEVEGLTVTELWIKESPTLDKSIAIGLDASIPVGSLFMGCYCENDEVWEAVKSGAYHGFSVEALVGLEEFESQIPNEDKVELEEEKPVETPAEEPKPIEKPVEEPKVEQPTEVKEEVKEEPTEPKEEPSVKTNGNEDVEEVKPTEEPKQDNHLEELINNLKEEIAALKEMNSGLQDKIKDLGKQPSAKPISTNAKPNPSDTYSAWRSQMAKMLNY